jgi:hypothetical protein
VLKIIFPHPFPIPYRLLQNSALLYLFPWTKLLVNLCTRPTAPAREPDAHGKFLRWRERNRSGYMISRRSPSDAMLHRTYCGHFEHGDKSASLTRTMKVCSRSKCELEA